MRGIHWFCVQNTSKIMNFENLKIGFAMLESFLVVLLNDFSYIGHLELLLTNYLNKNRVNIFFMIFRWGTMVKIAQKAYVI